MGIANNLSLNNVKKKHSVTYDIATDDSFTGNKSGSSISGSPPSKKGLFYSDVRDDTADVLVTIEDPNKSKHQIIHYSNAKKRCIYKVKEMMRAITNTLIFEISAIADFQNVV